MTSPNTVRTHAIFLGDEFYDWRVQTEGEATLKTEHRELQLEEDETETFLEDKTQKPVADLTGKDWQVIHVCEARLAFELLPREDAIAHLEELLESSRKGDLCYEPNNAVMETLDALLELLKDEAESTESIKAWFDQAFNFAKANW